jgi:hypothetical protein
LVIGIADSGLVAAEHLIEPVFDGSELIDMSGQGDRVGTVHGVEQESPGFQHVHGPVALHFADVIGAWYRVAEHVVGFCLDLHQASV